MREQPGWLERLRQRSVKFLPCSAARKLVLEEEIGKYGQWIKVNLPHLEKGETNSVGLSGGHVVVSNCYQTSLTSSYNPPVL